jgi:hypothetical protein
MLQLLKKILSALKEISRMLKKHPDFVSSTD